MLSLDPYSILDHIPYSHCSGEAPASFHEAKLISQSCRNLWAETFGEVCRELEDAVDPTQGHPNLPDFDLTLERRVKMFFILPFLILRKNPDKSVECPMNRLIKLRLALWKSRDYATLIQDYEKDVIFIQTINEHSPRLTTERLITAKQLS